MLFRSEEKDGVQGEGTGEGKWNGTEKINTGRKKKDMKTERDIRETTEWKTGETDKGKAKESTKEKD